MSDRSADYLDGMRDGMTYRAEHIEKLETEIERLQSIVKTAANNLDSVGAHHFANWCRRALEGK